MFSNNLHDRADNLLKAINTAAARSLPQGCRKDPVAWWDKELEDAVELRNLLRDTAASNSSCETSRNLWVNQCRATVELISKKREQFVAEFSTKLCYHSKPRETLNAIKELFREPLPSAQVAVDGIFSHEKKALAFRRVYAVTASKRDSYKNRSRKRDVRRHNRVTMYANSKDSTDHSSTFSKIEMNSVISSLHTGKQAGEDNCWNDMLKKLDADNRNELLAVINLSWSKGDVPFSWKTGMIIPIVKAGKNPKLLASYRPVCLMSCVSKLAERLVTRRLKAFLQDNEILSGFQSGFREKRSVQDVLCRLTSDVQKGRMTDKVDDTTAVCVDFSRAFDTIDHDILFDRFRELKIPPVYGKWYQSFLTDRRYRVKCHSDKTGLVRFAKGVPQGSVSGPLLFIVYMTSLTDKLAKISGLRYHFYADDSVLWHTSQDGSKSKKVLQTALATFDKWCANNKMAINKSKSEAILFRSPNKDRLEELPHLVVAGEEVPFKHEITLLGVTLNSGLTFSSHVDNIERKVNFRLRQMTALCSPAWGSSSHCRRSIYVAYVRSVMEYAAPAWAPFLSEARINRLEVIQNKAARLITGCARSTEVNSLLLESNLIPISVHFSILCAKQAERYRRFPKQDPMYLEAMGKLAHVPKAKQGLNSICTQSWQHLADRSMVVFKVPVDRFTFKNKLQQAAVPRPFGGPKATDQISISNRSPLFVGTLPANVDKYKTLLANLAKFWVLRDVDLEKILFFPNLVEPSCKSKQSEQELLDLTERTMVVRGLNQFDFALYTDASIMMLEKFFPVGAGSACLYKKGTVSAIEEVIFPTGFLSCSYTGEGESLLKGLNLLFNEKYMKKDARICICTDSQSCLEALKMGPLCQRTQTMCIIWSLLIQLVAKLQVNTVVFQYVPSHCGVPRNEAADLLAAEAMVKFKEDKLEQGRCPIPLINMNAHISRMARTKMFLEGRIMGMLFDRDNHDRPHPERFRDRRHGFKNTDLRQLAALKLTRLQQSKYAQLRTGEFALIGKLRHRLNPQLPKVCRWCNSHSPESVYHLYTDCTALLLVRLKLDFKGSEVFGDDPLLALEFCKEALDLLPPNADVNPPPPSAAATSVVAAATAPASGSSTSAIRERVLPLRSAIASTIAPAAATASATATAVAVAAAAAVIEVSAFLPSSHLLPAIAAAVAAVAAPAASSVVTASAPTFSSLPAVASAFSSAAALAARPTASPPPNAAIFSAAPATAAVVKIVTTATTEATTSSEVASPPSPSYPMARVWELVPPGVNRELLELHQGKYMHDRVNAREFLTKGSVYRTRPFGTTSSIGTEDSFWANDEIVDGFGRLCATQSTGDLAIASSQAVTMMLNGNDRHLTRWAVKRTRKRPYKILVFPVHCTGHWYGLVARLETSSIEVHDSLDVQNRGSDDTANTALTLTNWLRENAIMPGVAGDSWSISHIGGKQSNHVDCGFFLCGVMRALALGKLPSVQQYDMNQLRITVGLSLLAGQFLETVAGQDLQLVASIVPLGLHLPPSSPLLPAVPVAPPALPPMGPRRPVRNLALGLMVAINSLSGLPISSSSQPSLTVPVPPALPPQGLRRSARLNLPSLLIAINSSPGLPIPTSRPPSPAVTVPPAPPPQGFRRSARLHAP